MDYGNILSKAWRITWKHKILWVFGFLAGLGSGGGGGNNSGTDFSSNNGQGGDNGAFMQEVQRQLERPEIIALIIGIGVVVLILVVVLFVLSVIGRSGLIGGIREADAKDAVTFGEAWAIGLKYFWRMLGVRLILFLAGLLVAGAGIFTGLAGLATVGAALCILIPILCVLIIALIPLSIVGHFAQFGIVLEDLPPVEAFKRAWALIRVNVANVIIMGILMFVISFVIGLVLALPFIFAVLPAIAAFIANPDAPNVGLLGASGLAIVCLIPIAIVLGSILETWTYSVWALVYQQFMSKGTGVPPLPGTPPSPYLAA